MKRILIISSLLFVAMGCCPGNPGRKQVLAKINNYEITLDEFERDFKDSAYATKDTPESRKEFLDFLINKKLILQDAQKNGLDKDKDFLKMIENFWEHSLLKLTLERRSKEISSSVTVSDKEVQDAYREKQKEGPLSNSYESMYKQLKWEIAADKEKKAMDNWMNNLRSNAKIEIDSSLIDKAK